VRTRLLAAVSAAILMTPAITQADTIENVTLNYQSGAVFTGTVTFTDDFSEITGVSGTLTGYEFGTTGYTGSGSDDFNLTLAIVNNSAPGPNSYFFLDGPFDLATNEISFAYQYDSSGITLEGGGIGAEDVNNVDYLDEIESGSIGSSVPEPATLSLLGLGLGLVAVFATSRRRAV
jgi:PEP-CTERM motif